MPRSTWVLALLGLALRLTIVAATEDGGLDVRIYRAVGKVAVEGGDPYASEFIPGRGVYSDSPPFGVLVWAALEFVSRSLLGYRLFFAFCDVANVVLLAGLIRERRALFHAQAFFALHPAILGAFTAYTQDKTLILTFVLGAMVLLERQRASRAGSIWQAPFTVLLVALLAAYKWIGLFMIYPAVRSLARTGRGGFGLASLFTAIFVGSHALWFPDCLQIYGRRLARATGDLPPHYHASLSKLLFGLYDPVLVPILSALGLLIVYVAFERGRLRGAAVVPWALLAGVIWEPDNHFPRLLMLALPFAAVIDWSRPWRPAAVWTVTLLAAAGSALNRATGEWLLSGAVGPNSPLVGVYGSLAHTVVAGGLQHVAFAHAPLALFIVYWVRDRRAERAAA